MVPPLQPNYGNDPFWHHRLMLEYIGYIKTYMHMYPILTAIIPIEHEFHALQGQMHSRNYNPAIAARHSQLVSLINQWRHCTNQLVANSVSVAN